MYAFGALLARMNYISRWGLMRNTRVESLSEHVAETAVIASILAHIAIEIGADVDADKIASAALFHDAGEILNGDLPTPVKYRNEEMRTAYKKLEAESERRLLMTLPENLRGRMAPLVTGENLNEREKAIIKDADKFSALLKCIEEEGSGNTEFLSAKASTLKILEESGRPETRFFLEHFVPAYSLTLDELLKDVE